MLVRRVAPPSVTVWGAEVGGGDHDRTSIAPLPIVHAPKLIACPAAQPVIEKRRAQCRRVRTVPLTVQISVPTSSACKQFLINIQFKSLN